MDYNIVLSNWEELENNLYGVRETANKVGIDQQTDNFPEGYETRLGQLFETY